MINQTARQTQNLPFLNNMLKTIRTPLRYICVNRAWFWLATSILFYALIIDIHDIQAQTIKLSTLGSHLERFSSLSGAFKQENVDTLQDRRTEASGRFSFMKPGLMRWKYDRPDPYTIIVGSRRIWIFDPVLETVTIHNTSKIEGFKALSMLFEPEKLQSRFNPAKPARNLLEIQAGDKQLFLVYKQRDPNIAEIQIAFNADYQIRQFVIVDHNSNYRRFTLSGLNIGSGLDPSIFDFKIPEGVEIIDKTRE